MTLELNSGIPGLSKMPGKCWKENGSSNHDLSGVYWMCSIFISIGDQAADIVNRDQSQEAAALQCGSSKRAAVTAVRVERNPPPKKNLRCDLQHNIKPEPQCVHVGVTSEETVS